jgi:hypothetical protein
VGAIVSSDRLASYSLSMWSISQVADALAEGLARQEAQLRREQAVYGLDNLDEVGLHPLLAQALSQAGFGAFAECRYPAARGRRRKSEGDRCDLVVTPEGRRLREPDAEATLFDRPDAVDLADALWLEVKLVRQFTDGGPNARYAGALLRPPRGDVIKLASDGAILHAALLIILFTDSQATADHDLRIWEDRCLTRSVPIGVPAVRRVPISNRFGNACCTLALYPLAR